MPGIVLRDVKTAQSDGLIADCAGAVFWSVDTSTRTAHFMLLLVRVMKKAPI